MRRALLALAVLVPACGQQAKPTVGLDRSTSSDWQPLEIGWRWTYAVEGGGTCRRAVVARDNVGRFDCRVVEEATGDVRARYWLRSDRDGLKLFRFADGAVRQDLDDPAVWFKFPAQRGARWDYEVVHGAVELQCFGVYEDDERVRAPMGEFTCARVRTFAFCERTQVYEKVEWYSKGIGLVRQTLKFHDGRSMAMSLKELAR